MQRRVWSGYQKRHVARVPVEGGGSGTSYHWKSIICNPSLACAGPFGAKRGVSLPKRPGRLVKHKDGGDGPSRLDGQTVDKLMDQVEKAGVHSKRRPPSHPIPGRGCGKS